MKKSKILIMTLVLANYSTMSIFAAGTITNNSNAPINVVFYSTYVAPTETRSAQGRLNNQGFVIAAGQSYSFPINNAASIDVFYGNGTLPPLHATVNANASYTINPGAKWTITQD